MTLYKGPKLIQRLIQGDRLYKAEQDAADLCIEEYKKRLKDLGWFMKALNEPIARGTNKEDGVLDTSGVGFCSCKIDTPYIYVGQSIYKSQALLTEDTLLSYMAYVDLNPVRAKMADKPEESDHTSVKERISSQFCLQTAIKEQISLQCLTKFQLPLKLRTKFEGNVKLKRR